VSTVTRINELRHDRAELFDQMQRLNEAAEGRDFESSEQEQWEKIEADISKLERQISREEKLSGVDKQAITRAQAQGAGSSDGVWLGEDPEERSVPEWLPADMRANIEKAQRENRKAPVSFKEFNEYRAATRPQDDSDYRWAFFRYMTVPDARELSGQEQRVLSKASAGAGANLVPTSFQNELIQSLRQYGVMRQISRVIRTDSGEALQWPSVSSHGTAAWIAENGSFTLSDEAFGTATLNAYKSGTAMAVSEELLQDSAFDLDAYIRDEFGNRIGVLQNTAYVAGDGSGKPTGVATQATAGVAAAGAAAITADEWIDLFHSLGVQYRRNAVFLTSDSVVKLARKLKDSTNQYLWQPGLQAGEPDRLLGKPIYVDPDVAAPTTGNVSLLFGDFNYYVIRDAGGISFQRLNELYAMNGQVGFRAYMRTDGKLMNTAAVKKLTQA
jgi:HK97 family phage major capsid protein